MLVVIISQMYFFKPAKANPFHLEKYEKILRLSQDNQNKYLPTRKYSIEFDDSVFFTFFCCICNFRQ